MYGLQFFSNGEPRVTLPGQRWYNWGGRSAFSPEGICFGNAEFGNCPVAQIIQLGYPYIIPRPLCWHWADEF